MRACKLCEHIPFRSLRWYPAHVFFPERWPTKEVHPHPDIEAVVTQKKGNDILPSGPEDWKDIMPVTGWDTVLNRMATKLSGDVEVHCRANLARRVGSWLGATTTLRGGRAVFDTLRRLHK